MPLSEATGWGRPRLRGGGERFSRLTSSGRVSDYGAASRGTHFSRLHLQGAVGRYKNRQVRARLTLRSTLLRFSLICNDGSTKSLKSGKLPGVLTQMRNYRRFGESSVTLLDLYLCQVGAIDSGSFDSDPLQKL